MENTDKAPESAGSGSPDNAQNSGNTPGDIPDIKDNPEAEKLVNSLNKLKRGMDCTNFWFHLIRSNPRHREQYYFGFIAIVGYENWKKLPEMIRVNWESARLSFDRMYGMVKDFKRNSEVYVNCILKAQADTPPAAPAPKEKGESNKSAGNETDAASTVKNDTPEPKSPENKPDEGTKNQVGRIDMSLRLSVDSAKIELLGSSLSDKNPSQN